MDENRIKGTINEILGSAKQKVGELTGNSHLQVEGIVQQVKGDLENALGHAKDAVREANHEASEQHHTQRHLDRNENN